MPANSVSYNCPNCSAPLAFLPGHDSVTCEYCGREFTVKELDAIYAAKEDAAAKEQIAREAKWNHGEAGSEWEQQEAEHMRAFTCSSCGAQIICDENTMATECCYCGNPTMLPSRFEGMLRPDYIIPFQKTKEDAVAALTDFYKHRLLLPSNFTANNRVEAIQGMYVPFWLFDAVVKASGSYEGYQTHVIETSEEVITKTSVYNCERAGKLTFKRVPVDGSKKMDDALMDSIEPFEKGLQPFSTAYLAGFLADKYDVDADESAKRADRRILESSEECLRKAVNGFDSVISNGDCQLDVESRKVKYAMLPVWILTTRFKDKPYTFVMNGQTGKMAGNLPIDKGKLYRYSSLIFLTTAVILYKAIKFLLYL